MKKTMFLIPVVFSLTQTVYLWATDQIEHVQSTQLVFTKDAAPLPEQSSRLADETTAKQNLDLDKINSVGDKSLEYFDHIETSLTCLEEQLARLTAEAKNLRQQIDRLKFVIKNQVPVEKKKEPLVVKPGEVATPIGDRLNEKSKEISIKSEDVKKEEMEKEKEESSITDELVE